MMEPKETDYYNINDDWELIKKLVAEIEPDIKKFIGPRMGVNASIRARIKLNDIRKLSIQMRKKILSQREDNGSDYS